MFRLKNELVNRVTQAQNHHCQEVLMKNDKIKTSIWLIQEREHIGSSHPSIFTLKFALRSVYGVRAIVVRAWGVFLH